MITYEKSSVCTILCFFETDSFYRSGIKMLNGIFAYQPKRPGTRNNWLSPWRILDLRSFPWACGRCTLENAWMTEECRACGTRSASLQLGGFKDARWSRMVDGGMFQRWFTVRYRRLMCFMFLGWDDFTGKHKLWRRLFLLSAANKSEKLSASVQLFPQNTVYIIFHINIYV